MIDLIEKQIREEREKQDKKFGKQDHDAYKWSTILTEEVGEVSKAILDCEFGCGSIESLRKELIQVAAVSKAFIEAIDKRVKNEKSIF